MCLSWKTPDWSFAIEKAQLRKNRNHAICPCSVGVS
jgi:hypothetical protein